MIFKTDFRTNYIIKDWTVIESLIHILEFQSNI